MDRASVGARDLRVRRRLGQCAGHPLFAPPDSALGRLPRSVVSFARPCRSLGRRGASCEEEVVRESRGSGRGRSASCEAESLRISDEWIRRERWERRHAIGASVGLAPRVRSGSGARSGLRLALGPGPASFEGAGADLLGRVLALAREGWVAAGSLGIRLARLHPRFVGSRRDADRRGGCVRRRVCSVRRSSTRSERVDASLAAW